MRSEAWFQFQLCQSSTSSRPLHDCAHSPTGAHSIRNRNWNRNRIRLDWIRFECERECGFEFKCESSALENSNSQPNTNSMPDPRLERTINSFAGHRSFELSAAIARTCCSVVVRACGLSKRLFPSSQSFVIIFAPLPTGIGFFMRRVIRSQFFWEKTGISFTQKCVFLNQNSTRFDRPIPATIERQLMQKIHAT